MVTITVANHRPILGKLIATSKAACQKSSGAQARSVAALCCAASPSIALSPVGEIVREAWLELPRRFPEISLKEFQVMPDHFHGIIFVRERMAKPLGSLIRSFKAHSSSLAGESFWDKGFQDTILKGAGHLENMRRYILDNPRRLAVKRANPELFEVVSNFTIGENTFAAIGNRFLVERPIRLQVQCSRKITEAELKEKEAALLAAARKGAVLVSPCISPGEKHIARAALDEGLPLVVLIENGFPPLYKPPKTYFNACAAGHLLMLAPWPYHVDRRVISRAQCLALNRFASEICE